MLAVGDRILRADCVVQSGAPVYWCHPTTHCADNEWFVPLVRRRFRDRPGKLLLNLAAGSCQRYHDDSGTLCERCGASHPIPLTAAVDVHPRPRHPLPRDRETARGRRQAGPWRDPSNPGAYRRTLIVLVIVCAGRPKSSIRTDSRSLTERLLFLSLRATGLPR